METRGNYVMVGAFVLVLFVGLVGFVLWLGKFQADVAFDRYKVYFSGSVSGLRIGSPVSYRGVTVGEVVEVRLDPTNVERIGVVIDVQSDTPIKTNTRASLEMQGITGGSVVMLGGGTNEAPPLGRQPGEDHPVIASEASRLERLFEGAPALVESIDLLVRQALDLLNERNREAFSSTLQNTATFTGVLAEHSDALGTTLGDAAATMASLRTSADAMGRLSAKLETDLVRTLKTVDGAVRNLERTYVKTGAEANQLLASLQSTAANATELTGELRQLVAENRQPLRDFTSTGLYEVSSLMNELRALIGTLNRLTTEVGRDPARFIFGSQQQGYEAR